MGGSLNSGSDEVDCVFNPVSDFDIVSHLSQLSMNIDLFGSRHFAWPLELYEERTAAWHDEEPVRPAILARGELDADDPEQSTDPLDCGKFYALLEPLHS